MFKKIGSILLVALGLMGFLEAEQLSIRRASGKKIPVFDLHGFSKRREIFKGVARVPPAHWR